MIPQRWINEELSASRATPAQMDALWALGWRHFGSRFFRYNLWPTETSLDLIVPLRLAVADFFMSKSQRRVWRRNGDLRWEFRPAAITDDVLDLFHRHRTRFKDNAPESPEDFLGTNPGHLPCECMELRCLVQDRLIASSFLDIGQHAVSSIYAVFDPDEAQRSPGILTLLKEISWAQEHGKTFYYPGYATLEPGPYEYKKQLHPLQGYDWTREEWKAWTAFTLV